MDTIGLLRKGDYVDDVAFLYLREVVFEEGVARVILLGLLINIVSVWQAISISAGIFALLHFISYKWQMAMASGIMGLMLGFFYWKATSAGYDPHLAVACAFLICIGAHFIVGMSGWTLGLTKRWSK